MKYVLPIFLFFIIFFSCKKDNHTLNTRILSKAYDHIHESKEFIKFMEEKDYSGEASTSTLGVAFYGDGPSYRFFYEELSEYKDLTEKLRDPIHANLGIHSNLSAYLISLQDAYSNTKECYYFTVPLELVDEEKKVLVSFLKPFHGLLSAKVSYNNKENIGKYNEAIGYLFIYDERGNIIKSFSKVFQEKTLPR